MGALVSKSSRNLTKDFPRKPRNGVNSVNAPLAKKLRNDYLNLNKNDAETKVLFDREEKESINPKVYTSRPKEDEDLGDVTKSDFFQKAVKLGIVDVKEVKNKSTSGAFDKDNEALQLIRNRGKMEGEYEDVMVSQQKIEYDIPKRFLTKDQLKRVNKTRKKVKNTFGLIDGRSLESLIKTYKISGFDKMKAFAERSDTKLKNIKLLERVLESGLINLPSSRITLVRKFNSEGQVTNEKLVMIPDDWIEEGKGKLKLKENQREHKPSIRKSTNNQGKPSDEILSEFKKLESLIKEDSNLEEKQKLREARTEKQTKENIQRRNPVDPNKEVKRYL